jgi:hypothetical protein
MSHITWVETQIRDKEILLEVLKKLGYACEENVWSGSGRGSSPLDVVARKGRGFQVGFYRREKEESYMVCYTEDRQAEYKAFQDKVLQAYAREKILKEARRRNYVLVREQRCEDNRIRLVLRKVA